MNKSDVDNRLRKLWFSSVRVYSYRSKPEGVWKKRLLGAYILCKMDEGNGMLQVNDKVFPFEKGDWFLLPSGTIIEGKMQSSFPARMTLFLFSCTGLLKQPEGW